MISLEEDDFKQRQLKENNNYIPHILSKYRNLDSNNKTISARTNLNTSILDVKNISTRVKKENAININELTKTIRNDGNSRNMFNLPSTKSKKSKNDYQYCTNAIDRTTISFNYSEKTSMIHSKFPYI